MKKKLVVLFLIVALMTATSLSAMAKGKDFTDFEIEEVLFEATEITDINELQNRMKNNIKDDKDLKPELKTEDNLIRNVQDTNQKLKSVKLKNGDIIDSYVYTAIVTVYDEEYPSQISPLALYPLPGSNSKYGSSDAASVSYEIRIYYNWIGNEYIPSIEKYIDPLSCKTTILSASDSQISLTSMKASIQAHGDTFYYNGSNLQRIQPYITYSDATILNPNDTYRNNVSAYENTVNYYWSKEVAGTGMYGGIQLDYIRIPTGQPGTYTDTFLLFGTI
ncbi:MAG: hypothetical protein AB7V16_02805 [Vulcanibacillus sp.]